MEMFGFGTALRGMIKWSAAARRSRRMDRVLVDLPKHLRVDIGLDRSPRYFVPRMLGE